MPSRAILRIHPLAIVPKVQVPSMLHRPIILLVSFLPVDPEIPKLVVTIFTNQLMAIENTEKCIELQGWNGGYKLWRRRLYPPKLV
jgi:hypothetical protein